MTQTQKKTKTTGALFVAIVALVLGLLGAGGGAMGLVGALFQEQLAQQQQGLFPMPGGANEAFELQQQMQEELTDVNRRHRIPLVAHGVLNVLASLSLLGAGILLLGYKPIGPTVFLGAAAANALIDVGGGILGAIVQLETSEVMGRYMGAFTTTGPNPPPPGMEHLMDGIMQASATAGVCFGVGWVVLKIVYYVAGVVYLRRPHVRPLYAPSSGSAPPAQ